MTDIALAWDNVLFGADIAVAGGDLATDDGLRTAVIISLFTDAAARADDPLPPGADRRGWWGDALAEIDGDVTGSRLWLLRREKQLASVLTRAREYAAEALQWLVDDQIAATVDVAATNPRAGWLLLAPTITRPDGRSSRFDFLWEHTP